MFSVAKSFVAQLVAPHCVFNRDIDDSNPLSPIYRIIKKIKMNHPTHKPDNCWAHNGCGVAQNGSTIMKI